MKGKANTTGVKSSDGNFEPLPAAEYLFDIVNWEDGVNKNADPFVRVEFEVATGDHKGSKLWDNITFPHEGSPGAGIWGLTKHFLHCIGEPWEGDIDYDTDRWMCRQVKIETKIEPYQGKNYAKVKRYILDESLNTASTGAANKNPGGISDPKDIAWEE